MSKRKADFDCIEKDGEELPGQEVVWTETPSVSVNTAVDIEPTGRAVRDRVPVSPKGPQSDTCVTVEGHAGTPGHPAGRSGVEESTSAEVGDCCGLAEVSVEPVGELPSSSEGREVLAADWF